MSDNLDLLLIGAGPMAVSYAQVLNSLQIKYAVIGRGEASARDFEDKTGIKPFIGGIQQYLEQNAAPGMAIVATSIENLALSTELLLNAGVKNILLEKPGANNTAEIEGLNTLAEKLEARVLIAYNRRYYASTQKAMELVKEDGGLREVYFEFTEWSHVIEPSNKATEVKEKWFLANSTHVADLAFFYSGLPKDWSYFVRGGNSWHPAGTRFVGSGITEKEILFAYNADWESAGRWGVELLTANRRLYLRPMEQLFVQEKGKVTIEPVPINDELDKQFKHGLYNQVKAFLDKNDEFACTLNDQVKHFQYYNKMAGYND